LKRIGSATELASMLDRYVNARPDAPIVIASPTKEITDNGTVIIAPEALPVRASGPDSRAPLVDGASRPAPWREKPLDDILTATAAALSTAVASTEAGVTTSVGGPMMPSSNTPEPSAPAHAPRRGLSASARPARYFWGLTTFFAVVIVCVISAVAANRGHSSAEPAAQPSTANLITSTTTAPAAAPAIPKDEPKPIVTVESLPPEPPKKDPVVIKQPPPPPTVKPGIVPGIKPTPPGTGTKPGSRKPIIPF
jgi:hypothetical protein